MLKKQTLSTERVDPWPNPRESPKEKAHIQAHKSQTIWNHQGKNLEAKTCLVSIIRYM